MKPYLNLGCGRIIYPGDQHWSHSLVDTEVFTYPRWVNVDRNEADGVDVIADLFEYPWPLESNAYGGALLSHLVEHIPHGVRVAGNSGYGGMMDEQEAGRAQYLASLQDGWFAFFSELWRVLEPGAVAHILAPHGHSDGALADPTHTRYVMPHTFGYLRPDARSPFAYAIGCHFEEVGVTTYRLTELHHSLLPADGDTPEDIDQKQRELGLRMMTRNNVAYEFYIKMQAVKEAVG